MNISEFLEARIAEDEAGARVAAIEDGGVWGSWTELHNPARVLAECKAKRKLVADYARYEMYYGPNLFYVLAAVYADHPDYRQEWAP